jgi:hypothetical protein
LPPWDATHTSNHQASILNGLKHHSNSLPLLPLRGLLNIAAVSCAKVIPRRHLDSLKDIQKVIAISVMALISVPAIHGVWLPVNQFREYIHQKYSIGDNIQFNTSRLMSYHNKVFTNLSLEANEVKIPTARLEGDHGISI